MHNNRFKGQGLTGVLSGKSFAVAAAALFAVASLGVSPTFAMGTPKKKEKPQQNGLDDTFITKDPKTTLRGRKISLVSGNEAYPAELQKTIGFIPTVFEVELPDIVYQRYEFYLQPKQYASRLIFSEDSRVEFLNGGEECFEVDLRGGGERSVFVFNVKPHMSFERSCMGSKTIRYHVGIDYKNSPPNPEVRFFYINKLSYLKPDEIRSYSDTRYFSGADFSQPGYVTAPGTLQVKKPDALLGTVELLDDGTKGRFYAPSLFRISDEAAAVNPHLVGEPKISDFQYSFKVVWAPRLDGSKVAVPVLDSVDMLLENEANNGYELGFVPAESSPLNDPVVLEKEVGVRQEDGYATVYTAKMAKSQQGKEEFVISARDLLDFTVLGAPDFDVRNFSGTINATVIVKRDLVIDGKVIPSEASSAASVEVTVPITYIGGN